MENLDRSVFSINPNFFNIKEEDIDENVFFEIIENNCLTTYFQPIYNARDGSVYGFEALARLKGYENWNNIGSLFKRAIELKRISQLDIRCREKAISLASMMGLKELEAYLFINICPHVLLDPLHRRGLTDEMVEKWDIKKEKVVLEITEESAIENYKLFQDTVIYYKKRGYKIAIDDFGSGYGGLKMLSLIEPDFIKIDRYFISQVDKVKIKYYLVNIIVSACERLNIKVIAEGLEYESEMRSVVDMGVDFLQGYLFSKPEGFLNTKRVNIL